MDQVTQENAAMVDKAAAASRELTEDAELLDQRVRRFRLADSTSTRLRAAS
jgi:methyl-accepting chemotaxis protein